MPPSQNTSRAGRIRRLLGGVAIVGALAAAGSIATGRCRTGDRNGGRG
ncbi:multidrug efflux system membrane fusion protein [Bradyrhizobium huanghuaihaiense]|uniref:Multidrug efflux system membrane fusion protein n=1 Tax=Bradyrhizobium huanghuaihaiense TaxID=990078 RepID=A0A562RUH4_9BRAD|nr:multidrug efflux system membrane fusion protein [Bradyrhizobium huanghuaihaiense]